MLDENLPAFFLKPSNVKHHRDFFLSYHGSDPAPAYNLQHADPDSPSPAHKNCYAAALFDSYNPDVLYGEVLARPAWTQPTLSQEEIRRNGGVPPPPQPILPNEFTAQLYNPDQQVQVELREGRWGASDTYEFSMPMSTFRTPSGSNLDRGTSDPASLAVTPKINFAWRKESKLGKDLTCFMTGRSTDDPKAKKSKRDPDIAIALWRSMRELTIYEPNLSRVDIEDPKGLEVVLLLSAVVIKDLYFSGGGKDHMREIFNISDLSGGGRKLSNPPRNTPPLTIQQPPQTLPLRTQNDAKRSSLPKLQTTPPRLPPTDPRAQWEVEAETARLRAQADAEAREATRRRREQERADEAEAKRLHKMAQEEERVARRRNAEIEKETERLRKEYGVVPIPGSGSGPTQRPRPVLGSNGLPVSSSGGGGGGRVMTSGAVPGASSGGGGGGQLGVPGQGARPGKKKSFFGLRSSSEDPGAENRQRLSKKSSAMW